LKNANDLLDDLLRWFAYNSNSKSGATMKEVTHDYWEANGAEKRFGTHLGNLLIELEKVVDKLHHDKFIKVKGIGREGAEIFIVTFEGMVFCANGGYVADERRKAIKKIFQNLAIVFGAVGGILAGVYSFTEILKNIKAFNSKTILNINITLETFIEVFTLLYVLVALDIIIVIFCLLILEVRNKAKW
jgi:hypothetical protein